MVIVEGIGGPPALVQEWMKKDYFLRLKDWFDQLENLAKRTPKKYPSIKAGSGSLYLSTSSPALFLFYSLLNCIQLFD